VRTLTHSTQDGPLRLLQITDCHLFADPQGTMHDLNTRNSMQRVIDAAVAELDGCHAILATGDLSQDESEQAYRDFARIMAPLDQPVLSIPGNHDNPALMRTFLDQGQFQFCGAATGSNWLIIMLSSHLSGQTGGALSEQELDRMDTLLGQHPERHALICLHHQPVPIGSQWLDGIGLSNGEEFMRRVHQAGNVRGVVWGHVHQEFQSENAGIALLAGPSTCHQFVAACDEYGVEKGRSGYRILNLHTNGQIDTRVNWVET